MVEREGVTVVAGEFPVFLIAELRRIKVASEAENVVFSTKALDVLLAKLGEESES